jgi:GT2 family glycosyltransferase
MEQMTRETEEAAPVETAVWPPGIVIVNWNLATETIPCVASLVDAGADPARIYVVDNGSADDSVAAMRDALDPRVRLIESVENLGFSGGNNLGIRQALADGLGWVLLINNDTRVAPDFLARLAAATAAHPDFALLSPLILYFDEPERIWSLGDYRIRGTLFTRHILRNQLVPPDLAPFMPVDFLNACAILVRADVFTRIGLLDESFFMYAEDADFCWRANLAGFRLGCATDARMWHKVSRSTGVYHPEARYWRFTNINRFYRRYGHGAGKLAMFLVTFLRSATIGVYDLVRGRPQLVKPTLRGWRDGWFGPR